MMALDERRATALAFDPHSDRARVVVSDSAATRHRQMEASLLLDEKGHLVGIDARDEGGRGLVIMLGPHEAVAMTRPHIVEIHEDASSEPTLVVIPNAQATIRASVKNPYV